MDALSRVEIARLRAQLENLERAVACKASPARATRAARTCTVDPSSPVDISELQQLASKTALDVEDLEERMDKHREAIIQIVGARSGPVPAQEGLAPEPLLAALTRRLDTLEGEVSSLRQEKAVLADKVVALEKEVGRLTDHKGPIHALEYSVKRLWDERASMAKAVDTMGKERIGKVEDDVRSMKDPKGAVQVKLDSLTASVKSLWDERAALASRVEDLEESAPGEAGAAAAAAHGHAHGSPKPSPKLSPKVGPRIPDLNIARSPQLAAATENHAVLTKLHTLESSIKQLWDERARMGAKLTALEEAQTKAAEALRDPKGPVQAPLSQLSHSVKTLWDERAAMAKQIEAITVAK